jgi:hypothetical protein
MKNVISNSKAGLMGLLLSLSITAVAQPSGSPAVPDPLPAQESAPIDLTGQWVSIVNEDWLWRMVTPVKGDFTSVPLNTRGEEVGNAWDESLDGSCLAYGAAGIMRMPLRVRFSWASDSELVMVSDLGQQTRHFIFNQERPINIQNSLQGYTEAEWQIASSGGGGLFGGGGGGPTGLAAEGSLKAVTTNLLPAWLRRNGAPVSENAKVTEYFDSFATPDGDVWMVVTTVVEDPDYLTSSFITSSHFKRENNRASRNSWNPTACL